MKICLAGFRKFVAIAAACTAVGVVAAPSVVINEIHYHPSNDDDRLQYIEIANVGEAEADLTGWKLRGVKFDFPAKTKLAPGGFLVLARDPAALQRMHGTQFTAATLTGRLKRGGEKLELVNAQGRVVEKLEYTDDAPWPLGPDGYASSLERICPTASAEDPHNWASSKRASRKGREGTPGRPNDNWSEHAIARVEEVKWEKLAAANKPISVSAAIKSVDDVSRAILVAHTYRSNGRVSKTNEIELKRVSGDARNGRYEAALPAEAAGTLIRFSFATKTAKGAEWVYPNLNEPRAAFSSYVLAPPVRAKIPIATVINQVRPRNNGVNRMAPARDDLPEVGTSAFVYIPSEGAIQFFDFVQVRSRSGGYKVGFLKDQLLDGMSTINLVSEGMPRWVLSEHLSYELFRRAGMKIQNSGHMRVEVDGRQMGHMLWVEQPNKTFLARTGRNNNGNLYKIRWFEQDVVAAHEKKTNPTTGHNDISTTVRDLNKLSGEAQWQYIQKNFDTTNFANYYAVNMCVQNWDGFFNNHYVYRDTKEGSKWEVIPWDEDKTWGDYDGASQNYDWYEMPLTMGMNGERMPRSGFSFGGGGPFGGTSWWRPAGWFSGPLLANPQFRKVFLTRLKELCETTFTEKEFGPVIEGMKQRLRPEMPQGAVAQFDADMESFKRQLTNRRKFVLKEVAKELK
ncbi:MAG TPA: CotH kinase family protein [Verrucomicrobiae bacterium]